jgi:hypothetical protein
VYWWPRRPWWTSKFSTPYLSSPAEPELRNRGDAYSYFPDTILGLLVSITRTKVVMTCRHHGGLVLPALPGPHVVSQRDGTTDFITGTSQ